MSVSMPGPARPDWIRARRGDPRLRPSSRGRGRRCGVSCPRRRSSRRPSSVRPWLVKVETVQPTGSFKVRGGLAAVSATLEDDPGRAVVASSAGNHGLGLAYAASKLGAQVTVVVPTGASAAKVSALRQFDVRLVLHGEGYSEAEAHALELAAGRGQPLRVALQRSRRHRRPVHAGPRAAGAGARAGHRRGPLRRRRPAGRRDPRVCEGTGVRVIGVESEASPSMSAALAAGSIVPDPRRTDAGRRPGREPRAGRGDAAHRSRAIRSRCGR